MVVVKNSKSSSRSRPHLRGRKNLTIVKVLIGGVIICLLVTVLLSRRILDYNAFGVNNSGREPLAVNMKQLYSKRPQVMFFEQGGDNSIAAWSARTTNRVEPMSKIQWSEMTSKERSKMSKKYKSNRRSDGVKPPCVHQYEWQQHSYPTCNVIHENNWDDRDSPRSAKRINHGGWIEVWKIPEYDGSPVAQKTKLFDVEWTDRNFDRYRRDAVCLEQMSPSRLILDIYSYCGVTAFIQYCAKGDLENALEKRGSQMTMPKKLKIGLQVMQAIATVHAVGELRRPSIAHTDIAPDQFLNVGDDNFILNDFNRARFIGWDKDKNKPCGFQVGSNPGGWRSPEEYNYEEENEKVDVYSAGNILFQLLTGEEPFEELDSIDRKEAIAAGKRSHISHHKFRHSKDQIIHTMVKAIDMCWEQDPNERPSAREVADVLERTLISYKLE